ncbi:MAG: TetR/AcrR family transcriptional regulator [Erysipelotrichaceae bacterium]|nr:TetR/AcrR family transcriptional regulator [Erysipelotrichaceae bacterium]
MRKQVAKEYIREAALQLLEKKNIRDITICELVQKAGVSRATFYRNYLDIYQVIDEIARNITAPMLHHDNDLKAMILQNFRLLLQHKRTLTILVRQDLGDVLYRALYQTTVEHIDSLHAMNNTYQPHFFAGASYGMLVAWVNNDYKESPEQMLNLFYGCLQGYIPL